MNTSVPAFAPDDFSADAASFAVKIFRPTPETAREAELRIRVEFRGETDEIIREIRALDVSIRTRVAEMIFGQKLAGDLGLRSTLGHPTTDFGEPSNRGWDFDGK